jgi:hypothetical protein
VMSSAQGKERRRIGGIISTPLPLGYAGRIMIAKPNDPKPVNEMSVAGDGASALPATGFPKKVPTLRRGVKEMSAAISKVLDLPGRFRARGFRDGGR